MIFWGRQDIYILPKHSTRHLQNEKPLGSTLNVAEKKKKHAKNIKISVTPPPRYKTSEEVKSLFPVDILVCRLLYLGTTIYLFNVRIFTRQEKFK